MPTARTIVTKALKILGVVEAGEVPTSDELNDGLASLNSYLETLQIDKFSLLALTDLSCAMVSGGGSYTIGAAGNIVANPRPAKIEQAFIRLGTTDIPVDIVSSAKWFAIPDKTVRSDYPNKLYYEPNETTGVILVYPVPTATCSLHVVAWLPVSKFATLDTNISLAPGYERMLNYNLAIEVAPEYKVAIPPNVAMVASEALAAVRRVNVRPIESHSDLAGIFIPSPRPDIFSGE